MISKDSPARRISVLSALLIGQFILVGVPISLAGQERIVPQVEVGLQIFLPASPGPPLKLTVFNGRRSSTLIQRQQLTITDPALAGAFTAVDVWADGEASGVTVRLSIIYNDLSNPEWWKDKKEKVLRSLFIREGESTRMPELAQFGIEPFEMRASRAESVGFQPGRGPQIVNNTKSLEVVMAERSRGMYQIRLKNNSPKDVIAYTISGGYNGRNEHRNVRAAIAAGATHERAFFASNVDPDGLTIHVVVFADGTFEGDAKLAAPFLATDEGIRIQAPHLLRMVEQALQVDDAELKEAFETLESQLWVIPEAINKQSAIELLMSKHPSFDDETISSLYEELKGGLYLARNRALSPLGDVKRRIEEDEQRQQLNKTALVSSLRTVLERIKSDLERIIASNR